MPETSPNGAWKGTISAPEKAESIWSQWRIPLAGWRGHRSESLRNMADTHDSVPSSSNGGGTEVAPVAEAASAAHSTEIAGGADDGAGAPASGAGDAAPAQATVAPPPLAVPAPGNGLPAIDFEKVPSLRGMLFPGETGAAMKGLWAMVDANHGQPGLTRSLSCISSRVLVK